MKKNCKKSKIKNCKLIKIEFMMKIEVLTTFENTKIGHKLRMYLN